MPVARLPWPRLLALASISFALTLINSSLLSAVFGHKVLELAPQTPNTLLGYSTFTASILSIVFGPLAGSLSDRARTRFGRRRPFIFFGAAVLAASVVTVTLAGSIPVFILGVLLYRVGDSLAYTPWAALYPEHVPESQRGQGGGLKSVMDITGIVIGRLSAGELLGVYPQAGQIALWGIIAVSLGALGFALAAVQWALRGRPEPATGPVSGDFVTGLRRSLVFSPREHPIFARWFGNRVLFWTAFTMITQFLLLFVIDVAGLAEADAQRFFGRLAVVIGGMTLLIAVPAGRLADRIGRRPLVIAGCALSAVGTAITLFSADLAVLSVAGGLLGLGSGIFISANFAMLTDIVPAAEAGRFLGLATIASTIGAALAQLLGGLIIDPVNRWSGTETAGYLAFYGLAAVFFVLGLLTAFRLPVRKPPAALP